MNYSFSVKINMGNYESCSIGASLSSDVKKGESISQALERVSEIVEKEVDRRRETVKE